MLEFIIIEMWHLALLNVIIAIAILYFLVAINKSSIGENLVSGINWMVAAMFLFLVTFIALGFGHLFHMFPDVEFEQTVGFGLTTLASISFLIAAYKIKSFSDNYSIVTENRIWRR